MRRASRTAVALLLALLARTAGAAPPQLVVAPDAPVETVFRWATQRCGDMHLPDSPARALRTADGGIALLAAHFLNIPLLGRGFEDLAPACGTESRGAENPDPAAFSDRAWIQAVIPFEDGGRPMVLGLASHEYMGWRHPGRCVTPFDAEGRRPAAFRCWYSSITALVAPERDWRFRTVGAAPVAASPFPYDHAATARAGFFSVSNAIVEDGYATVLAYTEGVPGQPRGNCLLRAPLDDLTGGWRALSGGRFDLPLRGAYVPDATPPRPCDVVSARVFGGAPVRSIIQIPSEEGPWWVAVLTRPSSPDGAPGGVFASASRDLRHWGPARLLWAMTPFRSQRAAGTYYEYPSLIDHASPSRVFDRAAADASGQLHLYLTRLNFGDRRRGLDRDLVRLPVLIPR
ncbi:hypothetical protein ACE7GA_01210 [Roseomonas sp. CCTCC AB2023176]|uniref:hypothetical protein n=1 Tax=Roseomonas sp. CCTCC AB2023176 TaxID=3342640 RepID=UPI0035D7915B